MVCSVNHCSSRVRDLGQWSRLDHARELALSRTSRWPHANHYPSTRRLPHRSHHRASRRSRPSHPARLKIRWRAGNYAQNLTRRGLLLQCFGELGTICSFKRCVSRCKHSASCWRSSAIVCACSVSDVFTTGRRSFAFLFLEPFLVVVAIKQKHNELLVAGERKYDRIGSRRWQQGPQRLS